MFTDPIHLIIDTVDNSLPRVDTGNHSALYSNSDETLKMSISHQPTKGGRVGRQVRVDKSKVAADPFNGAQNREVSASAYLVVNEPQDGSAFTNDELLSIVKGLLGFLTDANVNKVLAGES